MKKMVYLPIIIAIILSNSISAQTGTRFGLKSGLSLALQYGIDSADETIDVKSGSNIGFGGGIFAYFPITESVGIQQELLYVMKGSKQDVTITNPFLINVESQYELNYFEMPMVLRYKFVNVWNVGIYGTTGIALSLLLDGAYNITTTISPVEPPIVSKESGDMAGVDTFDYSFIYGAGAEFKLFDKDFFLEYRMTIGWNTLAMPNAKGGEPVPLRNQNYIFTLGMFL